MWLRLNSIEKIFIFSTIIYIGYKFSSKFDSVRFKCSIAKFCTKTVPLSRTHGWLSPRTSGAQFWTLSIHKPRLLGKIRSPLLIFLAYCVFLHRSCTPLFWTPLETDLNQVTLISWRIYVKPHLYLWPLFPLVIKVL